MDLLELASGYLEAQGYKIVQKRRDFLHEARPVPGQETHDYLVWVPRIGEASSFRTQEGPYLSRFDDAAKNFPSATRVMLVDTREGLSAHFRSEATRYRVTVRVPVEFFDTPFRAEEVAALGALSEADKIRERAERIKPLRMPQSFILRSGDSQQQGTDLLDTLFRTIAEVEKPGTCNRPSINLVVGPAGIGKSVGFDALFWQLYDRFLEFKRQRRLFPRPLPLVPEHLRTATARNLKSTIESALRTDFALPIEFPAFEWMLTNGFAIWLLDGLDEIMGRDPEFFNVIWELLTKPGGTVPPVIVLCVRDSLLATSDNLRDFCEELEEDITIYEVLPWDPSSKRAYAERVLRARSEAERFIQVITTRPELNNLSSTPYYCSLLVDLFQAGDLRESYTESELLDIAVSSVLHREYDKGLLDRVLLPEPKLLEFLQALAGESLDTDFQGVDRHTVREYAEILMPSDLDQHAIEMLITHLVQIAVFSEGLVAGNIRFSQEILEKYLLGQYLYFIFRNNEDHFLQILSKRIIPSDWITLRAVAERVRIEAATDKLLKILESPGLRGNSFRNLLQIAACAVGDAKGLKRFTLEGHDLTGVNFKNMDFTGVSFRQCDLTGVEFQNCQLQGAQFEGAIIKNTAFLLEDREALGGATFGDMERVYSLKTERGKLETEQRAIGRWLLDRTGSQPLLVEPCVSAQQLRLLFGKFVYPNGVARRAMVPKRACLSGKEYYDRTQTLDAALRHWYLVEEAERYRERICRCEGDRYQELVDYVKNLTVSPGLERLLNDLCPNKDCPHTPRAK